MADYQRLMFKAEIFQAMIQPRNYSPIEYMRNLIGGEKRVLIHIDLFLSVSSRIELDLGCSKLGLNARRLVWDSGFVREAYQHL